MTPKPITPGKFVDGKQVIWDASSISTLQTCPKKYEYGVLQAYYPKPSEYYDQSASSWGHLYHQARETFDLALWEGHTIDESLELAIISVASRASDLPSDKGGKTIDNIYRALVWYTEYWEGQFLTPLTLHDGKPALESRFEVPFHNLRLSGRVDKLAKDLHNPNILWIVDTKTTTTSLGNYYFRRFMNDNQKTAYVYALRRILGMPVAGFIIDACQNLVGSNTFRRATFEITEPHIDEWLHDTSHMLEQAARYHEQEHYPRHFQGCFQYNGCPFMEVCSKLPEFRQAFLDSDFLKAATPLPIEADEVSSGD